MKFIVVQIGARRGYAVPAILEKAGMLERFYTDICADVGLGRWLCAGRGLPVIGSSGGGLPEAIGGCGVTFPNGNAGALAERMEALLQEPKLFEQYQKSAVNHLAGHRPAMVAKRYLNLLAASN